MYFAAGLDPVLDNNSDKLIAQPYDGNVVKHENEGGENVKIKGI